MTDNVTSLTERGQVSVPADIRRAAHLRPGQALRWEMVSDQEFRVYVTAEKEPRGIYAALGFAKAWNPTQRSTNEIMAELRAGEEE
jgi:bifunctional DNA-binding transcriptional regulator/antitoxin component of YhaV-PrlF toxin-antitoxin module